MAWNYRKRITIAPGVRLNVSKGGISTTYGMRGASITSGKNGTYLNTGIPGTGVYNRQKIGGGKSLTPNNSIQNSISNTSNEGCIIGVVFIMLIILIVGIIAVQVEDDSTTNMLGYLMLGCFSVGIICVIIALIDRFFKKKEAGFQYQSEINAAKYAETQTEEPIKKEILISYVKCLEISKSIEEKEAIIEALKKKTRGNTSSKYHSLFVSQDKELATLQDELVANRIDVDKSLDENTLNGYSLLCESFEKLMDCEKIWIINLKIPNSELKSSAAALVQKTEVSFETGVFNFIKSEYNTPILKDSDNLKYYIYPEYVIKARSSTSFDIININDVKLQYAPVRFIETDSVPSDSEIIDYTYEYVNKSGEPDKRYSYNPQHPIVQYGKLEIPKFGLVYHFSDSEAALDFAATYQVKQKQQSLNDGKVINEAYFDDISNAVGKLLDLYDALSNDTSFLKLVRESPFDIAGSKNSKEKQSLLGLFWVDLCRCYVELIGDINLDSKEGFGMLYLLARTNGASKITFDSLDLLKDNLLDSHQTLAEQIQSFVKSTKEPDGIFILSELLNNYDVELQNKYLILLYRLASIVAKADNTVSEKEAQWLRKLMELRGSENKSIDSDSIRLIDNPLDPMLSNIAEFVIQSEYMSTSSIQRRFSIGYNRAGRIADQLEAMGIVGTADGSKPRVVLIKSAEELVQIFNNVVIEKTEERNDSPPKDSVNTHTKIIPALKTNPVEELNNLIGLDSVKSEVSTLTNFIRIQQTRESKGLKSSSLSYHCVFTGNPGTGKTTVARIVADIYKGLGILKQGHLVETDRAGLVAEYVGQTAVKTNKIVDSALNGVLFIDEAYSLVSDSGNNYGKEAIATLLKRMEDDRDKLVVILAGYTDEMKTFIDSNPGLQSRFNRYIEFPDYSADELLKIFESNVTKFDYKISDGVQDAVKAYFETAVANKDRNFGNARFVRNTFEKTLQRQANRLSIDPNLTTETLSEIKIEDIVD